MHAQYTYEWFIEQFEKTKYVAEKFILSVNEAFFFRVPAEGRWSLAECYGHLIKSGDLYLDNIEFAIREKAHRVDSLQQPFPPRWLAEKLIIMLFEPPYKIKLKTMSAMKPDEKHGADRMQTLDEYLNLQNRILSLLEKARSRHVHLGRVKVTHPIFSILKMTLSECLLLMDVHQQRHQWQAEQTLKALREQTSQ